jgi:hypothetical protein
MMKEIVSQVIADVAKVAASKDSDSDEPVVIEKGVGKLPEGYRKCHEKGGRHNKAVFVHGEVVVDAMEEKMHRKSNAVIRKVAI